MAFSNDRSSNPTDNDNATPLPAAEPAYPSGSEALLRRARHRLIGAVLLVLAAVFGLPFLLDAPPRTVSPAIPVVLDGKTDIAASSVAASTAVSHPASAAAMPQPAPTPASSPSLTAVATAEVAALEPKTLESKTTAVPANRSLDKNEQLVEAEKTTPATPQTPAPQPAATKTASAPAARTTKPAASAERPVRAASQATPSTKKAATTIDELIAQRQSQEKSTQTATAATNSKTPSETGRFVVQAGAYTDSAKIASVRQKLSAAGLSNYTQQVTQNGKQVTRVRLGPFTSRQQMERVAAQVRALGLPVSTYSL